MRLSSPRTRAAARQTTRSLRPSRPFCDAKASRVSRSPGICVSKPLNRRAASWKPAPLLPSRSERSPRVVRSGRRHSRCGSDGWPTSGSPVAVDDIALERSASDAYNKLLENREYCIIFRALAAHAELTQRLVAGACAAALRAPLARVDHLALLPYLARRVRLTATYGLRRCATPPAEEDGAWDQARDFGRRAGPRPAGARGARRARVGVCTRDAPDKPCFKTNCRRRRPTTRRCKVWMSSRGLPSQHRMQNKLSRMVDTAEWQVVASWPLRTQDLAAQARTPLIVPSRMQKLVVNQVVRTSRTTRRASTTSRVWMAIAWSRRKATRRNGSRTSGRVAW